MVNFAEMNSLMRKAEKMTRLISAEDMRNNSDVMEICGSILDKLRQMQDDLRPLIESLDVYEERMIMTLRYLKGYKYPAIAEAMSMCQRSMYRYLNFAREKLHKRYPDKIELY